GAARRLVRDPPVPRPPHLPQLLPAGGPLAVHWHSPGTGLMKTPKAEPLVLRDYAPERDRFLADVLAGLGRPHKELPCKYFYDERGSQLFEQICGLKEYYLTRTELGIMRRHAAEMAARLGDNCLLIEFGSGSSRKTRLLLDQLRDPAAYVPIDISREHL